MNYRLVDVNKWGLSYGYLITRCFQVSLYGFHFEAYRIVTDIHMRLLDETLDNCMLPLLSLSTSAYRKNTSKYFFHYVVGVIKNFMTKE